MAVTTITIGRKPGSVDSGMGYFGTNTIRACTFNRITQNLWMRDLNGRLGSYTGVDVTAWLVCYRGTDAHVPNQRIAYYGDFDVDGLDLMNDGTGGAGGAAYGGAADFIDTEHRPLGYEAGDAAMLRKDWYISFAAENDGGGTLAHGMIASGSISYPADDTRFFIAANDGTPPATFPGGYTTLQAGHMSLWATCDVNVKPNTPVNRTESGLSTLTPTFEADFRDDNGDWGESNGSGRNVGDGLYRVNIIIRNAAGTVIRNVAYYASSDERANNRSSWVYDGVVVLSPGNYSWEIRHSDQFNEWSNWSSQKPFTLTNSGLVTLTAPTGKQLGASPDITGGYTHPSGTAAASARVIIKQGGAVVADSGWFAKAVTSGASFTITFASAGLGALAWGGSYTVQVALRTAGAVETPYSTVAFSTNAPPTTPTGLWPADNYVATTRPLVYAYSSDPDNLKSEMTVKAAFTKVGGSTVTATMAYNAVTGRFEFQTTSTQLPSLGDYTWVAWSGDGTLWSGGVTSEGSAERSAPAFFTYSSGPSVDITAPTDAGTFSTSTPTITVTAATQAERKITVTRAGEPVYTLDWEVSTVKSFTVPAGYIEGDGTAYTFTWFARDSGSLIGSDQVTATLDYDEPDAPAGLEAAPHAIGTDPYAVAVRLAWIPTTNPNFYAYVIKRDGVLIEMEYSADSATFIDHSPVSGIEHVYTVQVMVADDETAVGPSAAASAGVKIDGIAIHSEADPANKRLVVRSAREREETPQGEEAAFLPWGARAPVTVAGGAFYEQTSVLMKLGEQNRSGTGRYQREMLRALAAIGGPLFYRDGSGAAFRCTIPRPGGIRVTALGADQYEANMLVREEEL